MNIEKDKVLKKYFGDEGEEKKVKKKRKKSTEMYMTMNLNEIFATMTQERKIIFRDFCKWLFDEKKILMYFDDLTSPSNPLSNIDNVTIEWQPEVGKQNVFLHCHALVAIEHHGFY